MIGSIVVAAGSVIGALILVMYDSRRRERKAADDKKNREVTPAGRTFDVTFENEVSKANIWILPQTGENMKTTIWGEATIVMERAGETRRVSIPAPGCGRFMIRVIDDDNMYYAVNEVALTDGSEVIFKEGTAPMEYLIEVGTPDGGSAVYSSFAAKL